MFTPSVSGDAKIGAFGLFHIPFCFLRQVLILMVMFGMNRAIKINLMIFLPRIDTSANTKFNADA